MVSNLNPDAQEATLQVDGADFADAEVWRLDADHMGTQVEGDVVANGGNITLPAESLTLYVLE